MISKLKAILSKAELVAVAVSLFGFYQRFYTDSRDTLFLMIGLSLLAGVFFLRAFQVLEPSENTPPDSKASPKELYTLIVWKVMHIGAAVALDGLLFYFLDLKGYANMLVIGCASMAGGTIACSLFLAGENRYADAVKGGIMKILIILLACGTIIYKAWPLQFN